MRTLSDVDISYWLTDWCKDADYTPDRVGFKLDQQKDIIYIYAQRPGILIGAKGAMIDKHQKKLQEKLREYKIEKAYEIRIVEFTPANYWVDYDYMGVGE